MSTVTTQLHRHGFELVRQRKHSVYRRDDGKTVVLSNSPSDRNWEQNALSELARTLGMTKAELLEKPRRKRVRTTKTETPIQDEPLPPAVQVTPPTYTKAELKKLARMEKCERLKAEKQAKRNAELRALALKCDEWYYSLSPLERVAVEIFLHEEGWM